MNASYRWLREFTEFDLMPAQLRDIITARAATVEELLPLRDDLREVVVAAVIEAAPHPNSDHLWITKVDAGTGQLLDVVCGAPNVRAGAKYPFAAAGTTLPSGLKLEKRKIRGATSNGMLCSARELGLGPDHAGILELDTQAAPGTRFVDAYPAGDTRLVVDVSPNRADLLSHEGLAREIAAYTGHWLHLPREIHGGLATSEFARARSSGVTGGVAITVDAGAACYLYNATVIRGVGIAPSPSWLVERLEAVGLRSINNVVDVTNYMLHGFGQPMHAFDISALDGAAIHLRLARDGESITTLDGVTRTLNRTMTVIADAREAQAIAGVIGGRTSEVTPATTDILLEVAAFDPASVRRTRRALGVTTDASYRFERGVDARAIEARASLAAALIVEVAGGSVRGTPIVVGELPPPFAPIALRCDRVARLLGERVSPDECVRLLESVGFGVQRERDDTLAVTPPDWRPDVKLEADLAEEIARLRGYDTFSDQLRPFRVGSASDSPAYTVTRRVTQALVAAGLMEVRPMPFVARVENEAVAVHVVNPLAESESVLRSSLLQTLARRVEHNFAHMVRDVRLFEIGVAFRRSSDALPEERTMAAAVVCGNRFPPHFTNPKPSQVDIWDAKWLAETILRSAFEGNPAARLEPATDDDGWIVTLTGTQIGSVRQLRLDAPIWAPPAFGVEIDVTPAFRQRSSGPVYRPIPVTPAADFDLALVIPPDVTASDVERVIAAAAGDLLESLVPFDEFRGMGLPADHRSVAWHVTLRHPERTLREKEIEGRRGRILRALEEELGVRPRTA